MPRRVVREISRRVISERVIGSANPFAAWARESGSTCTRSVGGFFIGLLLFFATFALPYCAARTEKDSRDIERLTPISVERAASYTGKALIETTLASDYTLRPPKGEAGGILAYRYVVEELVTKPETHTETHKEVRNGKEVEVTEEVTEEVEEWETTHEEEQWQPLRIGRITYDRAKGEPDFPWVTVFEVLSADKKHREQVDVVNGNLHALFACELKDGLPVAQPDFYRLTSMTQAELVASMNTAEETQRWVFILASVILWTISLNLLTGPLLLLVNILPLKAAGGCARAVVTAFSLVIACFITWITYVAVRYWWVIVILLAALAVALVIAANRHLKAAPETDAPASS